MEKERRYLRLYFSLLFIALSVLLIGSLLLNLRQEYRTKLHYATIEGKSSYNKDLLYRRWASGHGGVYVPVTDSVKPNEYLSFIKDRDIVSTSGKSLTLINPAYMTRQVFAIADHEHGVIGHITSLKPIQPLNAPDEWEAEALRKFEQGLEEYSSIEKMPDGEYLRFMAPMKTEERCLVCHVHQGYKAGDIRGGISVSVPMEKYNMIAGPRIRSLIITHLFLYLVLIVFSAMSYRKFLRDMERKYLLQEKLEAARLHAEENDNLKTAFLQNMSHEIRTPMNAICGFADILDKPGLQPEKRAKYLSIIQSSSKQLLSIVTNVLTVSSIETKQEKINVEKVCINKLIPELLYIFRHQAESRDIRLSSNLTLPDSDSEIFTDRTKVTQILTNLLSNSFKFTSKGVIETGYHLKGSELELYVSDTGVGIKPEFHEKIFERFRQGENSSETLYGGTGLGLTISRSFTELLGGKIRVESEPGKGSTFYFTIPYKPANSKETGTVRSPGEEKKASTVLVVENEMYNYLVIEEFLGDMGLNLIHARDGKEAVDICRDNQEIDLVLMDIKMPVMDGHTAAGIIRKHNPGLPIVAQSAVIENDTRKYNGVFDEYLTKPIRQAELRKVVMRYVRSEG